MKTVTRAVDLLECFCEEQPTLSVGEIAVLLSVHKSIASRLAATLCARRLLQLDPVSHRYRIGGRMLELAQLYSRDSALETVSEPLLRLLVRAVGHASHVCVLDRMEISTVCCVASAHRLQVTVEVGGRRPVHATAAGKLFLAFGPEGLFEALSPEGKFPRITPRTIESRLAMRREIAAIRKSGIAHNREESAVGVGAVAAPLYGADGVLVASLTTIFPITMVSQRELRLLETEVRHTAERISAGLRGEPADAPVRPVRRAAR
jgi:DNA-binding IclR family transcriptional regulator